jgi:hypothetical protein
MAPPYVDKRLYILSDQIRPKVQISAIYRRIFKPKIFTDITTPVKQSYSPDTGKISVINHTLLLYRFIPPINTTMWHATI